MSVSGEGSARRPVSAPARLQNLAAPEWPTRALCRATRAPLLPPRLIAAVLLGLLCARFVMQLVVLHRSFPTMSGGLWLRVVAAVGAVGLGGSLWWVAKRQLGVAGAVVALLLFVTSPVTDFRPWTSMAALGVFGATYTAVGVAHALQGPRRKWFPRIAMMCALVAFTGACEARGAVVALCLSLIAMLYLMEGQRRLLPALFALWGAFGLLGAGLALLLGPRFALHWAAHVWVVSAGPSGVFDRVLRVLELPWLSIAVAMAVSLVGWSVWRRSRYFGNSAPLLAAALLLALRHWLGDSSLLWALPFALLFIAGVATDAWEVLQVPRSRGRG